MDRNVLVLTGTCGSGKSTLAQLLADKHGWVRFSEDDFWRARFHKNRGAFGSEEHRQKRLAIRQSVVARVIDAVTKGRDVVVDAICHEGSPDGWQDYKGLFTSVGLRPIVRVLHPRLEIAIHRDATRAGWKAGAIGVEELWKKFTGALFGHDALLDTSDDTPEGSVDRLLGSLPAHVAKPGRSCESAPVRFANGDYPL